MAQENANPLLKMAVRYIWWKTPEDAVLNPDSVIAMVMNLGDYEDVQTLVHAVGKDCLRQVLARAEAGQFNERSWTYWHYRLGVAEPGAVPDLPKRRVA